MLFLLFPPYGQSFSLPSQITGVVLQPHLFLLIAALLAICLSAVFLGSVYIKISQFRLFCAFGTHFFPGWWIVCKNALDFFETPLVGYSAADFAHIVQSL